VVFVRDRVHGGVAELLVEAEARLDPVDDEQRCDLLDVHVTPFLSAK
jgi:hypothetical protein